MTRSRAGQSGRKSRTAAKSAPTASFGPAGSLLGFNPSSKEPFMQNLKNERAIVTGGSSGLGLGVVESLVARGTMVMVVARDAQRLAEVEQRLGVAGAVGDVADRALAMSLLHEFRP